MYYKFMDPTSVNLNPKGNKIYIILSLVFVILSVLGIVLLFLISKTGKTENETENTVKTQSKPVTVETSPTPIATDSATVSPSTTLSPKTSPTASPSGTKITPTLKPTIAASPSGTKITPTVKPTVTTSSNSDNGEIKTFASQEDGFSVEYSSTRSFVQDKEATGNRYTFVSSSGNIAVHVATGDKWAWSNPSREFSNTFLVAGQPTFRYNITTQTIVDFKLNDKNYTIQCVHNNNSDVKAECDSLMKSFKTTSP